MHHHIHKSKKIIAALSIVGLMLFAILFMDSDETQYLAKVKKTISHLQGYSVQIENINLEENPEKLIETYEDLIKTAKTGLSLTPPSSMVYFDTQLNNYLKKTISGYYQLIEGTRNKDLELIKKGIGTLAQIDDSFLKQIVTLDKKQ